MGLYVKSADTPRMEEDAIPLYIPENIPDEGFSESLGNGKQLSTTMH